MRYKIGLLFMFCLMLSGVGAVQADIVTPDDGPGTVVGRYSSVAVVNGNPAISYWDAGDRNLKYVRATDANGTTWGTPVVVDAPDDVGEFTSLVVVNGHPAISYHDQTNSDLKYVRATDANGTAWGAPVVVDGADNVGAYTSLTVVNGNPAISYYSFSGGDLRYVRATDANGTTWGTPIIVDTAGTVGFFTSLVVVNGNPAISYSDNTNFDLKYVRATDADGTTWGTPIVVDAPGNVGRQTSLLVVNGNPAISYHDVSNRDVKYVRATDADGTTWGTPIIVDAPGRQGSFGTSLQIVSGHPAISYHDNTNGDLKYVRATDMNGTAWGTPIVVDALEETGETPSLAVVNGNPAISYADRTNNDLRFARACDALGADWQVTCPVVAPPVTPPIVVDPPPAPEVAQAPAPALRPYDPAISKIGFLRPGEVGVTGESLEWVVTISNTGSIDGTNVQIIDDINPRLRITSVDAPGATVDISGQVVTVTYPRLRANESRQFSIFTTVISGASVDNTACVVGENVCATGTVVAQLPSTGETPWWRDWIMGLVQR